MHRNKMPDQSSMIKTPILIFACDGFWCPMSFSTPLKFIYKFHTVFTTFLIASFMMTQLIDVLVNYSSVTGFVNNCITLMPTINAFCKAMNLLVKRQLVIQLMRDLGSKRFDSRDGSEDNIKAKYKKWCKWINTIITTNTLVTLECMVFAPIITNPQARVLPFPVWLPYSHDNREILFWCTFIWEKLSASAVGLANLANDLLVISIMMQLSGQLDVLNRRLIEIADGDLTGVGRGEIDGIHKKIDNQREKEIRDKFIDCIHHHRFILKLAEEVEQCFVWTFAIQILVSLSGTCTGAYQLARTSFGNPEFTAAALFIGCMISEAFLYCWFGNEVRLKSMEVENSVYKMDWVNLGKTFRKDLLNVCFRAKRPIIFTSGPTTTLSNEFFVHILQLSYSAFTVLREISVEPSLLTPTAPLQNNSSDGQFRM